MKILENVHCDLTIKNPDIKVHQIVPAAKIEFDTTSNVLIGLKINPDRKVIAA